jgi:hypothetical protein
MSCATKLTVGGESMISASKPGEKNMGEKSLECTLNKSWLVLFDLML